MPPAFETQPLVAMLKKSVLINELMVIQMTLGKSFNNHTASSHLSGKMPFFFFFFK